MEILHLYVKSQSTGINVHVCIMHNDPAVFMFIMLTILPV
jgi:hypothetical protein